MRYYLCRLWSYLCSDSYSAFCHHQHPLSVADKQYRIRILRESSGYLLWQVPIFVLLRSRANCFPRRLHFCTFFALFADCLHAPDAKNAPAGAASSHAWRLSKEKKWRCWSLVILRISWEFFFENFLHRGGPLRWLALKSNRSWGLRTKDRV